MLTQKMIEEMMDEPEPIKLSVQEEAYRRGYYQGFSIARNRTDVTESEVRSWRYSYEETAPPGSGLAGKYIPGLEIDSLDTESE